MEVQLLAEGLLGKWTVYLDNSQAALIVANIKAGQSMSDLPIDFNAAWVEGSQGHQDCTVQLWDQVRPSSVLVRWDLEVGGGLRYFSGDAFGQPPQVKMTGTVGSKYETFGNWLALKEVDSMEGQSVEQAAVSTSEPKPSGGDDAKDHDFRSNAPPLWARLVFGAVVLGGFYGLVAMAFFLADDDGHRADAALKLASALGPLLGAAIGAMASYFFSEQERQASTARNRRLEGQLGESNEAQRSAEAGTAVAMAMLSPDQRVEMLNVRDLALRARISKANDPAR